MKLLATLAIIVATAMPAKAQTITVFQSGFEPTEGYAPGNLNGQNGWFAYLGADLNFGKVSSTGPLNGSQSILLDGMDVQVGPDGNYAAVGRLTPIAPNLGGAPLRYIEVTGLCAVLDPTIDLSHRSHMWLGQYQGNDFVTKVGAGSWHGQLVFGYPLNPNPITVPVRTGVAFQFRHLVDYQTGLAVAWKDGAVAFETSTQGFDPSFITNEFYFESLAFTNLPYDTRVWFDDIRIKAIYGCAADTNRDAVVNVDDLLVVINGWGPCPASPNPCPGSVVNTGSSANRVDVDDLLAVINGWGPCK